MVPRMLHLRCAGHGPKITAVDARKAVARNYGAMLTSSIRIVVASEAESFLLL